MAVACGPETNNDDSASEGEASSSSSAASSSSSSSSSAGSSGTTAAPATTSGGSSSSGTTESPTASSSATTGVCEFICEEDSPGPTIDCDIFAQDCPEGQKCAAYDSDEDGAWDSTKCVTLTGDGQLDDPCTAEPGATGVDDCDAGYMCWNVDEEGMGTCYALCTGSPENPMCPEGGQCAICQTCVIPLCIPDCDPLLQDCGNGELCVNDPNSGGFVCVLDASEGDAPEGTPCEFVNVCNKGTTCVSPDFYPSLECMGWIGCCAPFCDTDNGDADCVGLSVADAECVAFYGDGEAPPGYENVGVCGIQP